MEDTAIDRVRRDVLLSGQIEAPVAVDYELLVDVAVGAADVNMRAGVVGDESRVLTAPRAREIFRRFDARGTGADQERRRYESQDFQVWLVAGQTWGNPATQSARKLVTTCRFGNQRVIEPSSVVSERI